MIIQSGYIGKKMSKNAAVAHEMGQFPISKIDTKILKEGGFNYSVAFFKWLCRKGYIVPIGYHHTGLACKMTKFYSLKTINYVVDKYNLDLLYDMYLGKKNKEDAKRQLGIKFVKAKIPASLLHASSNTVITVDFVKYQEFYFISDKKWICPSDGTIKIDKMWDSEPSGEEWRNRYNKKIVRKIILFKDIRDVLR